VAATDLSEYCRFLACENDKVMQEWIGAIRNAKNRKFLEDHPEYLSDINLLKVSAEKEVLNSLRDGMKKTEKVQLEKQQANVSNHFFFLPLPSPRSTDRPPLSILKSNARRSSRSCFKRQPNSKPKVLSLPVLMSLRWRHQPLHKLPLSLCSSLRRL